MYFWVISEPFRAQHEHEPAPAAHVLIKSWIALPQTSACVDATCLHNFGGAAQSAQEPL